MYVVNRAKEVILYKLHKYSSNEPFTKPDYALEYMLGHMYSSTGLHICSWFLAFRAFSLLTVLFIIIIVIVMCLSVLLLEPHHHPIWWYWPVKGSVS